MQGHCILERFPLVLNPGSALKNLSRNLKKQLISAIEKEDFEKAAELRDQLKALEKGSTGVIYRCFMIC